MPCLGRIQIRRARGWKMPPNTVGCCRPTVFGNPFPAVLYGREQAVALHAEWIKASTAEQLGYTGPQAEKLNALRAQVMKRLPSLRGKNLACFCPEPERGERDVCHCVILMEKANG